MEVLVDIVMENKSCKVGILVCPHLSAASAVVHHQPNVHPFFATFNWVLFTHASPAKRN
jgi:hypothetical protein